MTRHRQTLASLVVLGLTAAVVVALFATREPPPGPEPRPPGVLVEVVPATQEETVVSVAAQGTVRPVRTVELRAQVGGMITRVSPALVPGSEVDQGEVLVRIDPGDFEAARQQAQAAVTQAQADLDLERGRRQVAEQEWRYFRERFDRGEDAAGRDLALREPQLAAALGRVRQAEAQLRQADLNLERTVVTAPFDATVRAESAAVGQLAGPQTPIATLVSRGTVWVEAAVPAGRLPDIAIPGVNHATGSPALVRWDTGGGVITRNGRVIELLPSLSAEGGMARLLIEVPAPPSPADGAVAKLPGLPLLHGAYVDVELRSLERRRLTRVPRRAVRNGDEIFVFEDGALHIVTPEIVWRTPEAVFIAQGMAPGSRVVVTPLAAPVDGMPLRLASRDEAPPAAASSPPPP